MTNDMDPPRSSLLTLSQEHYLKKYLLGVLLNNELDRLQKNPYETLPNLGGPFDLQDQHANSTTPFLRYLFESIVVPFPFLTSSRGALWPKLQLFMDEWAKIEAGNGVEREEMIRRKRLKNKGEKSLVLMYSMAIKTVEQRALEKKDMQARQDRRQQALAHEDSLYHHKEQDQQHSSQTGVETLMGRLSMDSNDKDGRDNKHLRPEETTEGRSRSQSPAAPSSTIHGVKINVVGVRAFKEKRHVREHEHAEFIVSSILADGQEFVVARRHGRFRRLYQTLRHDFPQYEFPLPPSKFTVKSLSNGITAAREKDRISLRGYLHNLARTAPEVVNSKPFVNFLTKDPILLSAEEARDVQVRISLDEHRMAQQAKFDREVAKKVDELDSQLKEVKLDLLQPGGISRLFRAFKDVDNVNNLPPLYQSVFEWGCMNFASTLYHVFTSSDEATLNFTQLKRTHMLLPYRTMWGILKVSNPMAMMKGIMDLFLAQPFGSRSLMQRIISGNMQEEVTEYKKDIAHIEASIADPGLCEKIRNYVYAPNAVISQIFPDDEPYDITELSLVMDVLKSDQINPLLSPLQIKRVWDAQQKLEKDQREKELRIQQKLEQQKLQHQQQLQYASSDGESSEYSSSSDSARSSLDDVNPFMPQGHGDQDQPEFNLIRQLQQLLVAHLRIRDKERMMGLVFQGVTGEIFKELIAIFYQPLVKVYKSANIADSLFDVKEFVDELIKIVEQADMNDEGNRDGSSTRPSTATLYLNLVRRHLPSFYKFVHSVHKQDDGIFHDLLEWMESIINFMRTGFARTRIDYKTEEELRVAVDLDQFLKENVDQGQWDVIQAEAEALRVYFSEVKDRKREEVKAMAGLDRASNQAGLADGGASQMSEDEQRRARVAQELKGMGLQQEDVDELEMMNYDGLMGRNGGAGGLLNGEDDGEEEGEQGLKVPKVPLIDTLRGPFVHLMDKALFQTARE